MKKEIDILSNVALKLNKHNSGLYPGKFKDKGVKGEKQLYKDKNSVKSNSVERMLVYTEMLNARIVSQEQAINSRQQKIQIISSIITTLNVSFIYFIFENESISEVIATSILELIYAILFASMLVYSFKPLDFKYGHNYDDYYKCSHPKTNEACTDDCLNTASNILASKIDSAQFNDDVMAKRIRNEFIGVIVLISIFSIVVLIQIIGGIYESI